MNHQTNHAGKEPRVAPKTAALLLAPINMLLILLAALAVAGISLLAVRNRESTAPLPGSSLTVTTEAVPTSADLPVISPVTETTADTPVVTVPPATTAPTTTAAATEPPKAGYPSLPAAASLHAVFPETPGLLGSSISSANAILVNCDTNTVVASKYSEKRIYPASLTKVMTILTAALAIPETELTSRVFQMTQEIIDPLWRENATRAGFAPGENVVLIDYFYGAILPSGADATTALAIYCAGSEKAFADRMNETAAMLGLKNSHFTNASGLHDPNHYTTVYDLSVIFRAALSIPVCRDALCTYSYTTHSTSQNPSGITLYSTGLVRLSPYTKQGYTYVGAKTGYTPEAKQCLGSYIEMKNGNHYLFICAGATDKSIPPADTDYVVRKLCK